MLYEAVTGGDGELPTLERLVSGYPRIVLDWIRSRM
jgi:hypothetical protein